MKRHYFHDAIERELEEWPGVKFDFGHGGKHPYVEVFYGGSSRKHTIPSTPSDPRGALNSIADIRRSLRLMGAEPKAAPPAGEKRERNYAPPREVKFTDADRIEAKPSPFLPLENLQRSLTREALAKWADVEVNTDRLDEASRLLIAGWHPAIIKRAHEMIASAETGQ